MSENTANNDKQNDVVEHDMLDAQLADSPQADEASTFYTNQQGSEDMSNTQQTEPAKKGGLVTVLALLTGLAGTGIGVYNYDLARKAHAGNSTAALEAKIAELEKKLGSVSADSAKAATEATQAIDAQVKEALAKVSNAVKAEQEGVNKRLSQVEQLQNGLSKTLKGDLKNTLDKRLNEVSALLNKVDQIELTQKGISQNVQEMVAAKDALTAEGMAKQEISYLVRMAEYKTAYEGDVVSARGLLKIAKDKLLLLTKGQRDTRVGTLEQAIQLLDGVERESNDVVISQIKALAENVNKLKPKEIKGEGKSISASDDTWGKIEMLLVSGGMKIIPGDPNNIDITAETGLVEKRFLQIDLFTAELAIRSQNLTLLGSTLDSINKRIDTFFAADDNAKAIKAAIDKIKTQRLKVTLPDLSKVVELFKAH